MQKNKWKWYCGGFILSTLIMIMTIVGIFEADQFSSFTTPQPLKELPKHIGIPGWIIVEWTFPFYFTIQSNFFVIIYFFLMTFKLIQPNKNKHAYMFELIALLNIIITGLVYWTILAWNTDLLSNWYILIENIGLHLVVPIIMVVAWSIRIFKVKNQEVFVSYKEIWKFFIFPILWLIMAIIVYYSSRKLVYYQLNHVFSTNELANQWSDKLNSLKLAHKIQGNSVQTIIPGIWGNAIYFFLNFDHIYYWITILCIFVIAILILALSSLIIALSNNKHNLYIKWVIKKTS